MKHQPVIVSILLACIVIILSGSATQKDSFDKITVREFELVDDKGIQRVSIKVEPGGQVVFRLRDKHEVIRLKMGADENGSGLVLLDSNTNPGIHALVNEKGAKFTVSEN